MAMSLTQISSLGTGRRVRPSAPNTRTTAATGGLVNHALASSWGLNGHVKKVVRFFCPSRSSPSSFLCSRRVDGAVTVVAAYGDRRFDSGRGRGRGGAYDRGTAGGYEGFQYEDEYEVIDDVPYGPRGGSGYGRRREDSRYEPPRGPGGPPRGGYADAPPRRRREAPRRGGRGGSYREVRDGGRGGGRVEAEDALPDDWKEASIPCSGKEPGRIIGKGGATINRIQDDTGARIDVLREEKLCVVSGSEAAVDAAVSAVKLVMAEGDGPPGPWSNGVRGGLGGDFVEEIVPCSGLGPGRVIGKGGATVNRLQDETGARIEVRAEDGQCFVSGTVDQVAAAVEAVTRIIEEGDGYVPLPKDGWGGGKDGGETVEEIVPCAGAGAIGRIIGKRGQTVSQIEQETGARIQVDQRLLECVITGSPREVEAAVSRVRRVMVEGMGGTVLRIPCTGSEGLIIGPRGSRVRRMATDSKASIKIEQVSDVASECVIQGSADAVAYAADLVTELIETEIFYGDEEQYQYRPSSGARGGGRGRGGGRESFRPPSGRRGDDGWFDDRDGYYDERFEGGSDGGDYDGYGGQGRYGGGWEGYDAMPSSNERPPRRGGGWGSYGGGRRSDGGGRGGGRW